MTHASESQHWYSRTGDPAYEVKAKAGHMRPTTLADARKLGLVPGVSTILGCSHKPALEMWKIDQAVLAALTLPRIDGESSDAFVARVKVDAKETARKAAERGTAIHACIQGHYEGEPADPDLWDYIKGAAAAVRTFTEDAPGFRWVPELSFACPLGFGGKCDLSNRIDSGALIDFKSKEFGPDDDLRTWDEHAMQLASYRVGLGMPRARGAIGYVSVTHPGLTRIIEIPQDELAKGWRMFCGLLDYWKAKTGFESGWMKEAA